MEEVWWYATDDKKIGAITLNDLLQNLVSEQINLETLVWKQGWDGWLKLNDVEEIRTEVIEVLRERKVKTPPPLPNGTVDSSECSQLKYAKFWQRFAALTLDSCILLPFLLPVSLTNIYERSGMVAISIAMLASAIYFTKMESSESGATYGKRWVGIKVIDLEGKTLTKGRALSRWISHSLSYIGYIGFLIQPFTTHKQALHDLLARTVVIQTERAKSSSNLVKVICVLPITIFVIGIIAAIVIPSYRDSALKPIPTTSIVSPSVNEGILSKNVDAAFAGDEKHIDNTITIDPSRIEAARKAGYSDYEIASFIGKKYGLDSKISSALDSGYSPTEIVDYLGKKFAPKPSEPAK